MKTCRGYTLIEVMIVVAIVGILASLAIPMVNQYRMKALNASALSDVRNLLSFETAFALDYGEFAPLSPSDMNSEGFISATINLQNSSGTALFEISSLNKNVILVCKTSANNAYGISAGKHKGGDLIIANDMDQPSLMKKSFVNNFDATDLPASTANDDLSGAGWSLY